MEIKIPIYVYDFLYDCVTNRISKVFVKLTKKEKRDNLIFAQNIAQKRKEILTIAQ